MDKKAYLDAVSALMLEGWAMLPNTCPQVGCENCALLGHKATNEIQCVNCKAFFIREADAGKFSSDGDLGACKDGPEGSNGGSSGNSVTARVEAATARMGELMLQGWGMMAESCEAEGCPGIPLMRRRGATEGTCVLCDPDLTGSTVVAPPAAPASSPSGPAVVAAEADKTTKGPGPSEPRPSGGPPAVKPEAAWQKRRGEASSKMGAKLLGG